MGFLRRLSEYLVYLGVPGVFTIALLDSAAVPLVGGPDAAVLFLSWRAPSQALWIALAAAIGSLLGCLVLYRIGRAGSNLALSRLPADKRERIRLMVEKNTTWAAFMAVTMPPPFPTKPIVLTIGALRAPLTPFAAAVLVGRLARFSLMAWLGARFGDQATQVLREHYLQVLIVLVAIVAVYLLARRVMRKRPAAEVREAVNRSTDLP